jgi:hypothetical protein
MIKILQKFKRNNLAHIYILVIAVLSYAYRANAAGNGTASGCEPGRLCNPLQSGSIQELLLKIIDVLLIFAQPLIILYIMYAGYLFVTAQGNGEQVTKARGALMYAIIGGVLVLGARLILGVVQGTIAAF